VVLANGSLVIASADSNPDLFWALKGGGTNFGVVTHIRMRTFAQGNYFGIGRSYRREALPTVFRALANFLAYADEDKDTVSMVSFSYDAKARSITNSLSVINSQNDPERPGFRHFSDRGALHSSNFSLNASAMANLGGQPHDTKYRKIKFSITVKNDAALYVSILNEFLRLASTGGVEEADMMYLTFQPLTSSHLSRGCPAGQGRAGGWCGNALGLSANDGPLMLIAFEIYWLSSSPNSLRSKFFRDFSHSVHDSFIRLAEEKDFLHHFVFLNYAASWQRPFDGYGKESVERLREMKKMWDPECVFERLQSGGHKII
jgi:hypothetical protein